MSKTFAYASAVWMVGAATWAAGCSSTKSGPPAGNESDAASGSDSSSSSSVGDSGEAGAATGDAGDATLYTYTLIDDMETGTNGPIKLTGINPPETPAYWFNFGASKPLDAGTPDDTATPPITMFAFSALPTPTTTLNGTGSSHAAHQACTLNVLYDVCGIGVEFAQIPDLDAGTVDASTLDAGVDGDAGPSIPRTTVPFDISQYKGITFWGRTAVVNDAGAGFDIKVAFPDTDTDPRGGVCNGENAGASGPNDTSQCYNSYSEHVSFTNEWQQFTVLFADLALENFGFQAPAPWSGTNVYGINWQSQDNASPDATNQPMDVWIDDVYFVR